MTLRPLALLMASIGCSLALGAAACSSSSSSGTGGAAGGVVPTGGTTGAGAAAGAAGATPGSAGGMPGAAGGTIGTAGTSGASGGTDGTISCGALPACIASVVAACPVANSACLVSATASGNTSTHYVCLGNPVTVKVVESFTHDLDTGASSHSISVTKGGAVCYTLDGTFNSQDPVTTPQILSFKNDVGVELATFSTDLSTFPNTTTVTCTGGQATPVPDFGNCGMPNNPEPEQCVGGGACTAP